MERLTTWNEQTEMAELIDWNEEEWKEFMSDFDVPIQTSLSEAFDKLAHYEDLEEQGLLLKLPCKVGDKIWEVDKKCENDYWCEEGCYCEECSLYKPYILETRFEIWKYDCYVDKEIFLTKEEAEAKLQELQNGVTQSNDGVKEGK